MREDRHGPSRSWMSTLCDHRGPCCSPSLPARPVWPARPFWVEVEAVNGGPRPGSSGPPLAFTDARSARIVSAALIGPGGVHAQLGRWQSRRRGYESALTQHAVSRCRQVGPMSVKPPIAPGRDRHRARSRRRDPGLEAFTTCTSRTSPDADPGRPHFRQRHHPAQRQDNHRHQALIRRSARR